MQSNLNKKCVFSHQEKSSQINDFPYLCCVREWLRSSHRTNANTRKKAFPRESQRKMSWITKFRISGGYIEPQRIREEIRELMRKENYEFLIFSEYSFVQLTNMKANAQRIYRKDLWLIPLTQLLIVQRSVINMGKSESRFESSEPACLNTHTSDDKLGKLSWILALFPVTLTPGFYLLLNFGL